MEALEIEHRLDIARGCRIAVRDRHDVGAERLSDRAVDLEHVVEGLADQLARQGRMLEPVGDALCDRLFERVVVEHSREDKTRERRLAGSVIAIIPTADRAKATVKVRIALKRKDPRIVPDMGVRVAFLDPQAPAEPSGGPVRTGVLVPAAAVRPEGGQTDPTKAVVFVYAEGKVERRRVTVGQTDGSQRQVLSGLRAGERVVLSPPDSLRDGAPVRLAEGA